MAPKFIDSSPTAKVLASRGSDGAFVAVPGDADSSPRTRPKMSTVTAPARRKFCAAWSCAVSWLTKGTAVFAAANRWECTTPLRAAGSAARTIGM